MPPMRQTCPRCGAEVARPADEGGLLVRARFIIVKGQSHVFGCPRCAAELHVRRGKLLLVFKNRRVA